MSLGIDGGSMFTSVHNGVTAHIKHNVVFYACSLLCTPNFVKILSTKSLVNNIEKLVIKVYFYFSQFGKKILELERLDICWM